MHPAIFATSAATPLHAFHQRELLEQALEILAIPEAKIPYVRRIFNHSSIQTRYSVVGDFHKPREEWEFWGPEYPKRVPGMAKRNQLYKKEAPLLAEKAARGALLQWGGDPSRITHLISVSCTGMIAPGIEYLLMDKLGLKATTNRLGINFMGCFGAFKGLSVAHAFSRADPSARILLVCTELCTLHLQADSNSEPLMSSALFGDGSAAAIIGGDYMSHERPLWEIHKTYSAGFKNSIDKMSWEASDTGFLIGLSHTVPVHIKRNIKDFVEGLLPQSIKASDCDWAIHPGGASILQAIENTLCLDPEQTRSSWNVLRDYGNMSSATFLFVLDQLHKIESSRKWAAGIGFGPGLSAEGILLRKAGSHAD